MDTESIYCDTRPKARTFIRSETVKEGCYRNKKPIVIRFLGNPCGNHADG